MKIFFNKSTEYLNGKKINLKTVNNYNNKCQGLSSGKRQQMGNLDRDGNPKTEPQ